VGTPEYLAPEQAADARQADIRSDVYSLGCTLYHLLTGRPPFVEPTAMQTVLAHVNQRALPPHELRSVVPPELSAVVARMLEKEPIRRYQTPREVADALARFCESGEASAAAGTALPGASVAAVVASRIGGQEGQRRTATGRQPRQTLSLVAAGILLSGLIPCVILVLQPRKMQYLSDMQEFDVRVVQGPPGVPRFAKKGNLGFGKGDPRYAGGRIRVNGRGADHGLSMGPAHNDFARASYKLGKSATTFTARVALDDSAGAAGLLPGQGRIPTAVTFEVVADGKVLWSSRPVDETGVEQECRVDVAGVDILELRVHCPGNGDNAFAVWLEPRVSLK
jgi:hypothetical protein